MTLDEAIRHCEEVAEGLEKKANTYGIKQAYIPKSREPVDCISCATEHRQLAEWLNELKELREGIGSVKLSNMKEALAVIRTLKAELNGWKDNPFVIIAEVCSVVTDCKHCQWDDKCPYTKNYEGYPEEWRDL